jgi:hypothetical protein
VCAVNTWFNYRVVWGAHPWIAVYAAIVAVALALSIWATVVGRGLLMILFVPALLGLYMHHEMVRRRLP